MYISPRLGNFRDRLYNNPLQYQGWLEWALSKMLERRHQDAYRLGFARRSYWNPSMSRIAGGMTATFWMCNEPYKWAIHNGQGLCGL